MSAALQTSLLYGKLTVIRSFRAPSSRHRMCECICQCGVVKSFRLSDLACGKIRSCGCERAHPRHGACYTPAWWSWKGMRRRCSDPLHKDYRNYGGRGIRVCPEWNDPLTGFVRFLSDMGERPSDRTLDRKDVDGPYTKANCRWATKVEQEFNKRRWTRVNERRRARQRELQSENAHWDDEEAAYLASATMQTDVQS